MLRHTSTLHRGGCAFLAAAIVASMGAGCAARANMKSPTASRKNRHAALVQDSADDQFQRSADRPASPRTLYALAQILQTQGKDSQAEPVLCKIINDEPRFMPAYCDLAEIQMRQRRIDEAANTLSAGLKQSADEPILINDRGMCHLLLHDYEAALGDFVRATALVPDDARYRTNMAVALAMLGRYDEAFATYSLVMPPADAYYNLALISDARGDAMRAAQFRGEKRAAAAPMPVPGAVMAAMPALSPQPAPASEADAHLTDTTESMPAVLVSDPLGADDALEEDQDTL